MRKSFKNLFSAVSFLLLIIASLEAQTRINAFALRLVVTDAQNSLIADAQCVLRKGEKTIAQVQTNEGGAAIFQNLEAGVYQLTIEKDGFGTYEKKDVAIGDNSAPELTVALDISSVSAQVTIEDQAENVNAVESGSSPAAAVQRKSIERLPLATKRIDEAIPLVPGVIRSSRGEISIDGAKEQQSAFRLNGVNAADPASGNFRLNLPVDAVESVQVFRHPFSAEFGQFTGGLTDIQTRRGGDKLHFEINDFLPDFRFIGGKIVGVQDDSPHVNFNGPIIKDKFYFSQSLGYTISKQPVRGLKFPNNETITESQSSFTQLDYVVSPTHTAMFTFGYFPERDSYIGLDFFRPRSVTPNFKTKDFTATLRDDFAFKNGGLLQTSLSYKRFNANVWGQGTADQNLTPTGESGNYFATQARHSDRFEFLEIYSFPTREIFYGTHNIKAGFDFQRLGSRMNFAARPVNIYRADGTLVERETFSNARQFNVTNQMFTGFAQDRWIVRPNFSLDFGARIEDQRIASEKNIAPRAGFAFSPFAGDKTVVRGGIGYFYDKVPLNIRLFNHFPSRMMTAFAADGQTVTSQTLYRSVLVDNLALVPLGFRQARTNFGFVPVNLTWNLQVDQIVNRLVSVRANYTHSRTTKLYIIEPLTDFFGRSANVLSPTGRATYDAFELTAKLNLPQNQPFYISYVRSKARGDLNDFNSYYGDFGAPIIRANQYSNLSTDVPNRLLAWGNIALKHKIDIAPIVEWRSGFPFSVIDQNQNFVGIRNAPNQRFPNFFSLDAEISKDFQVTPKYAVRLSVKVFNLTGHLNPRNVRNNTGDPNFGSFINNYRRYFTGGFDIIF